ncbi:MAG: type I restriction endonuclease [Candidatus Scalindua sp.]
MSGRLKHFLIYAIYPQVKGYFSLSTLTRAYRFYRGGEIVLKKEGKPITSPLQISRERYQEIITKNNKPKNGDILLTAVGTLGVSYLVQNEEFYFKDGNVIWFKDFHNKGLNLYLYDYMQSPSFKDMIDEITIGSTQNAITIATIGKRNVLKPNHGTLLCYHDISEALNRKICITKDSNLRLYEMKSLILSKLSKEEGYGK